MSRTQASTTRCLNARLTMVGNSCHHILLTLRFIAVSLTRPAVARWGSPRNTSVASAVTGPTPGWVISSLAPERRPACSATWWFSFSISAPMLTYISCNALRRIAMPETTTRLRYGTGYVPHLPIIGTRSACRCNPEHASTVAEQMRARKHLIHVMTWRRTVGRPSSGYAAAE